MENDAKITLRSSIREDQKMRVQYIVGYPINYVKVVLTRKELAERVKLILDSSKVDTEVAMIAFSIATTKIRKRIELDFDIPNTVDAYSSLVVHIKNSFFDKLMADAIAIANKFCNFDRFLSDLHDMCVNRDLIPSTFNQVVGDNYSFFEFREYFEVHQYSENTEKESVAFAINKVLIFFVIDSKIDVKVKDQKEFAQKIKSIDTLVRKYKESLDVKLNRVEQEKEELLMQRAKFLAKEDPFLQDAINLNRVTKANVNRSIRDYFISKLSENKLLECEFTDSYHTSSITFMPPNYYHKKMKEAFLSVYDKAPELKLDYKDIVFFTINNSNNCLVRGLVGESESCDLLISNRY